MDILWPFLPSSSDVIFERHSEVPKYRITNDMYEHIPGMIFAVDHEAVIFSVSERVRVFVCMSVCVWACLSVCLCVISYSRDKPRGYIGGRWVDVSVSFFN